jgi:hypothetical protein
MKTKASLFLGTTLLICCQVAESQPPSGITPNKAPTNQETKATAEPVGDLSKGSSATKTLTATPMEGPYASVSAICKKLANKKDKCTPMPLPLNGIDSAYVDVQAILLQPNVSETMGGVDNYIEYDYLAIKTKEGWFFAQNSPNAYQTGRISGESLSAVDPVPGGKKELLFRVTETFTPDSRTFSNKESLICGFGASGRLGCINPIASDNPIDGAFSAGGGLEFKEGEATISTEDSDEEPLLGAYKLIIP